MPSSGVDRLNPATKGFDLGNDMSDCSARAAKGLRLEVLQGRCDFSAIHTMVLKVGHGGHQDRSGGLKGDCDSSNLRSRVSGLLCGPARKFVEVVHDLGCFGERENCSWESDNFHGVGW